MNILMITPQPFFSPRGTPFSVYYRARSLGLIGHSVDILTYHLGQDVRIPNSVIHRIPRVPFVHKIKIGPSLPKLYLDIFLFLKAFRMLLRRKYDCIHAHEEGVFFCLVYKLFFPEIKIIYDMHSSLPQQLKNFGFTKSRLLIGIFRTLERWAIRQADAVITICPELQKIVEDLHVKTPSVMIENSLFQGVDYSGLNDEIPESLINWKRLLKKTIILYTGTFEPYQGIPLLLRSANLVIAQQQDVLFILIGGTSGQIMEMRALAQDLRITKHVLFTGNLHPNSVKHFIRRADVLVSPRIKGTNSPLKLYEYIASGKPIVATNHQTHTQILSDKEAILVDPSPESFASGILMALKESPEELGRHAKELYDRCYSQDIYSERLKKLLQYVA